MSTSNEFMESLSTPIPENPLFSIICPVYNCEDYLDDLVMALAVNANDPEVEWIFVHDCATDASEAHLRNSLAARANELQCSVVHLVHAENRGLAAARNTGIRAARGEYIGFLDSDDIPLPGFATIILNAVLSSTPEVLEIGYAEFVRADDLLLRAPVGRGTPAVEKFAAGDHFSLLFAHNFFAWTRIVKRDLFARVMFTENKLAYEDIPYSMALFCEASAVHYLPVTLIGYRKRPGSITNIRDHRFLDQYTQLRQAIQIYRQHPEVERRINFELRLLRKLVILLLKGVKINTLAGRKLFFQSIHTDLQDPQNPFKHPASVAGRILARILMNTAGDW